MERPKHVRQYDQRILSDGSQLELLAYRLGNPALVAAEIVIEDAERLQLPPLRPLAVLESLSRGNATERAIATDLSKQSIRIDPGEVAALTTTIRDYYGARSDSQAIMHAIARRHMPIWPEPLHDYRRPAYTDRIFGYIEMGMPESQMAVELDWDEFHLEDFFDTTCDRFAVPNMAAAARGVYERGVRPMPKIEGVWNSPRVVFVLPPNADIQLSNPEKEALVLRAEGLEDEAAAQMRGVKLQAQKHSMKGVLSKLRAADGSAASTKAITYGGIINLDTSSTAAAALSDREVVVLSYVACGYSSAQSSTRLVIPIDTIRTHTRKILRKLGANNRVHACKLAFEIGLFVVGKHAAALSRTDSTTL